MIDQSPHQSPADEGSKAAPLSQLEQLPFELLICIANHLDTSSAMSLALVSSACRDCATDRLWRYLDLSVERPRVIWPDLPVYGEADFEAKKALYRAAELAADADFDRVRALKISALRARADAVLRQGEKRWSLVKALTAIIRSGVAKRVIRILDHVSPSLQVLRVQQASGACPKYGFDAVLIKHHARLRPNSSYPSLLHVFNHSYHDYQV